MIQYAAISKSLYDQFNADTVQIAARDADYGFGLTHVLSIESKNNEFCREPSERLFSVKIRYKYVVFTIRWSTSTLLCLNLYDRVVFLSINSHFVVRKSYVIHMY